MAELRERQLGKRTSYQQVQARLAKSVAPLSASTIHRYEAEGRSPDALGLVALAELYRVDPVQLFQALRADLAGQHVPGADELIAAAQPEAAIVEIDTPDGSAEFVSVPVLAGRIAAGAPLVVDDQEVVNYVAFAPSVLKKLGVTRPLAVRVGRRERSMYPTIKADDTVLLDCSDARRESPRAGRIYAVNVDEGTTLKRIAMSGEILTLIADNLDKDEYPLRTIDVSGDVELKSLIVGEAVWWGASLL